IAVKVENTFSATEREPVELFLKKDFEYINTGVAIQSGYDAVVMIEDVIDAGEGKVKLIKPARPLQNIRVVGESVSAFEMLFPQGYKIRAIDIGCLIASTSGFVKVTKKPKVGIIPTGGELIEDISELKSGKLMESNTKVFSAMCHELGAEPKRYDIVPDEKELLKNAVLKAAEENDMVLLNAGSSAGTKDYAVSVLSELGTVYCHGLAIKPGKPTILAEVKGKPVIGIPGYPVSAQLVFMHVVKPLIERLLGKKEEKLETAEATLTRRVTSSFKSLEFVRVSLGEVNGKLVMTPLDRGAAAVMSMVKADGLLYIPRLCEGYEAGETLPVSLLKPLGEIKEKLVLIGSYDMIIDLISCEVPLSSAHVGSLGGISALLKGACHIAPIHLLDAESGEYNIPFIKKYFKGKKMALIKGVNRIQGFYCKKGEKVMSLKEVKERKLRFANRQSGAGTRLLTDYLLKNESIDPEDINGYDKEFTTHLSVAAAVAGGEFDTGIGVYSAAKAFGLEFYPLLEESYDFLLSYDTLSDDRVKMFIEYIKSNEFMSLASNAGGYEFTDIGKIEIIE
ncbi:MAG: molybdopterin biosynthesis protein, partial [Clostridiales bacterium]|nr:molybdopterin biosynthesis protein [Clostridiales bacterium]